jgi:endonuclease III
MLIDRLRVFYGALPAPPAHAFGVYIWEVLSIGTTPARRDAAFKALRRIPALTPDAVGRLPQAKLESALEHAGPMKEERIRALRAGADLFRRNPDIVDEFDRGARRALKAARRVPHLGRASSLRLLLYAAGIPVLPLDEHAFRVAQRLGYGMPADLKAGPGADARADFQVGPTFDFDVGPTTRLVRATRRAVVAEASRDIEILRIVSQYLTHHGLATCTTVAPHCSVCPLAPDCEWIRRQ